MKIYLTLLVLIILNSCRSPMAFVLNDIKIGMTKEEVLQNLGKPNTSKAIGENEFMAYYLYDNFLSIFYKSPFYRSEYWVGLKKNSVFVFGRSSDFNGVIMPMQYKIRTDMGLMKGFYEITN